MRPDPASEAILKDFLGFTPTKTLAKKYGVDVTIVKRILRETPGDVNYLKAAHRIGAKIIARRLKSDPEYRKSYVNKMRCSVTNSLSSKMENPAFRNRWHVKAIKASEKGNERIKELMHDAGFLRKWKAKCQRGGEKSVSWNLGIHHPRNAKRGFFGL